MAITSEGTQCWCADGVATDSISAGGQCAEDCCTTNCTATGSTTTCGGDINSTTNEVYINAYDAPQLIEGFNITEPAGNFVLLRIQTLI